MVQQPFRVTTAQHSCNVVDNGGVTREQTETINPVLALNIFQLHFFDVMLTILATDFALSHIK